MERYSGRKIWRCFVADFLYHFSGEPIKELVDADVYRYLKWDNSVKEKTKLYRLNYTLIKNKEFRNVFYYRMCHHPILCSISRIILPCYGTVEIAGGIDGGLFISHNHCVVFPKEAGKNLRIGPGVVIGRNGMGFPTIGDNVYIAANSTVIGGVHIGNNVIIGAGSVVTKDIPDNGVYVGNPAHFVKPIDDDERLLNEIK